MTTFEDRQKTEERKFEHDEELRFRIRNRRNKLLGLWIAREHLKLGEDEQAEYAKAVVLSDFEVPGDSDVLAKVHADLAAKGLSLEDSLLIRRLRELENDARDQVMSE